MVGPGRTQEIYAGDSLKLQVHGKYLEDKKQKANAGSFMAAGGQNRLIADLNELAVSTQRAGGANPIALLNLADIVAKDLQKKEAPEAYLMYALYDQDSNRYEVGKKVLTRNAANQHEVLGENMYIAKDGYMETFVVNETSEDVWFDNLMVASMTNPVAQETHYDPWGLELTGIGYQYGGIKANKYLYNGKELLDDQNLGLYDYGARYYDPVIGRWTSPDPMASKRSWVSPYNFVQNNPMLRIDPDGRLDDYYGIVNDELVYLGNDGQGNNIRLVSEGQHEQALSILNGVNTTDAQRATLRNGNLSQTVTFNEGNIQREFQGASDRTINNQLENSVIVTLDPATATVDAQPGAEGTSTRVSNTVSTYGSDGMWTEDGSKLFVGVGHGHPTVTETGKKNGPGYSKGDSETAGNSSAATYAIDSYNSRVGGAATIHQARPGGTAGTNPVGTTQNTNNIGRRSFISTAKKRQ
jgi:RHS repeat-associated protein